MAKIYLGLKFKFFLPLIIKIRKRPSKLYLLNYTDNFRETLFWVILKLSRAILKVKFLVSFELCFFKEKWFFFYIYNFCQCSVWVSNNFWMRIDRIHEYKNFSNCIVKTKSWNQKRNRVLWKFHQILKNSLSNFGLKSILIG